MRSAIIFLCLLALPIAMTSCRSGDEPAAEGSHIRIETAMPDSSPAGKASSGGATAEELGIAFYPGAHVKDSTLMRTAEGVTGAVKLETTDAFDEVLRYYRTQCAPQLPRVVKLDSAEGRGSAINWQTPHGNFNVIIKQDLARRRTLIHLIRSPGKVVSPAS